MSQVPEQGDRRRSRDLLLMPFPAPPESLMPQEKILIVDDEKLIRWSLRQRLETAGYRVLEADCGSGALACFDRDIDLVLLDLRLPDIDGLAVLRKIRQLCESAAVILMTAYGSPETVRDALAEGALGVVNKPFDFDNMLRIVAKSLPPDAAPGPR